MFTLDDIVTVNRDNRQLNVTSENFSSYFLTKRNPTKSAMTVRQLINECFGTNRGDYELGLLNSPDRIRRITEERVIKETREVWAF